jgi:hypothetical protein
MRIGIQMQRNTFGNTETDDYVTFVKPHDTKVEIEFVYTEDPKGEQDSGWIILDRTEALELAHCVIAVASKLTRNEQASFGVTNGHVTDVSIGK